MTRLASIVSTFTAGVALAAGLTGCVYTPGGGATDVYVPPDPTPSVAEITIDPGASMNVDPGNGVGLFVQYDEGGAWTINTTCDTAISGASCNFDVVVSADPGVVLDDVQGVDLDAGDSISLGADGSINLVTDTSFGTNGMTFDADPGATIEVDVLLDGDPQPRYVYVISDGQLLSGVPTNPVDFSPAAP